MVCEVTAKCSNASVVVVDLERQLFLPFAVQRPLLSLAMIFKVPNTLLARSIYYLCDQRHVSEMYNFSEFLLHCCEIGIKRNPFMLQVVKRCWATPERSPGHSVQYSLIEESCSVPGSLDGTVRIVENGVSKRARWEGSVFKFVNFEQVWLHCSIQVCFGNGCQKVSISFMFKQRAFSTKYCEITVNNWLHKTKISYRALFSIIS